MGVAPAAGDVGKKKPHERDDAGGVSRLVRRRVLRWSQACRQLLDDQDVQQAVRNVLV